MGTFFGIVLILIFIVVIAINVVGLIKDIKEKIRAKRQELEEQREEEKQEAITEGKDNACSLYDCYSEIDSNVEEQEQRKDV